MPGQVLARQVQCMRIPVLTIVPNCLPHSSEASDSDATVWNKKAWTQLSPGGKTISNNGWLEHHVREMCNELRPEVSRCMGRFCDDALRA